MLARRFLRPVDFLDSSDDDTTKRNGPDKTTAEKEVLETVESFYKALTTGDQDVIERIYSQSNSKEVSEVRSIKYFFEKYVQLEIVCIFLIDLDFLHYR